MKEFEEMMKVAITNTLKGMNNKKFEYCQYAFAMNDTDLKVMNSLGEKGWRLICHLGNFMYFERVVREIENNGQGFERGLGKSELSKTIKTKDPEREFESYEK